MDGTPTTGGGTANKTTGGGKKKFPATVNVFSDDTYGDILVDSNGFSLYLFVPDKTGKSTCYDQCANVWPPLISDGNPTKGDAVTAPIGTISRKNGAIQVTIAGHPLYKYKRDKQPSDTNGQDIKGFGGEWYLLAPDGSKKEEQ